ncbi:MAG: hypothetical protein EFT35_07245 [Methanophagales archaeon ANME-1-THS]|nr:MAG: hypothetical protein EFT35_07245 [Methanophagales archaeon ANME-1-THS]
MHEYPKQRAVGRLMEPEFKKRTDPIIRACSQLKMVTRWDEWGYHTSSILVLSILYFNLNTLDFVITTWALAHCDHVWELNPFFQHPFFALMKPFVPVYILLLYFSVYLVSKSEQDRRSVGRYGLGCMMLLVIIYDLICLNNLMVVYLAIFG